MSDLCLFENKIVEAGKLSQFSGKEITMIRIEYKTEEEQIFSLEWLFKMDLSLLTTISIP